MIKPWEINKAPLHFPRLYISLTNVESVKAQRRQAAHIFKWKGKAECFCSDGCCACHAADDKQAGRERLALICQTCSDTQNALAFRTDKNRGVIRLRVTSEVQWPSVCFSSPWMEKWHRRKVCVSKKTRLLKSSYLWSSEAFLWNLHFTIST